MAEQQHRATLRDYLQVLNRRKFVILGTMLVGAVVAFALTLTQSKTYTASASLQAQTLQQVSGLAGVLQSNQQLPQQTSAVLAQTATREQVMRRVKEELQLEESTDDIRSNLSISQDQTSSLVTIEGSANSAIGAARLTNAVANAVAETSNEQAKRQFARLSDELAAEAAEKVAESEGTQTGAPAPGVFLGPAAEQARTLADQAARLAALSKVADLVQVTVPATSPSSPSAPKREMSAAIGAVIGLVLGLLLSWLLESMDRRLRRPDEAEAIVGLPLVGALPKGVLGTVPGNRNGKSKDAAADLDAFRMLRTNARFLGDGEGPRTILVTSPLSEEGKTTVALGLAAAAATSGMRTLLIEADIHRSVHADRLGLKSAPGLTDYLHGGVGPREVLQQYAFKDASVTQRNGNGPREVEAGFICMTAGRRGAVPPDEIGSPAFAKILDKVKGVYDLVIVDSAPLLAVAETSQLVPLVDAVLLIVRMGHTTTEQTRAARDALDRLPHRLSGTVITELSHDAGGYYGYGSYAYDYRDVGSTEPAAKA